MKFSIAAAGLFLAISSFASAESTSTITTTHTITETIIRAATVTASSRPASTPAVSPSSTPSRSPSSSVVSPASTGVSGTTTSPSVPLSTNSNAAVPLAGSVPAALVAGSFAALLAVL
ncbi:hypothetical protein TMatcc_000675 [Talaromyces marneffei ATCC 18224]|uniref:GPI anchored protein n=2 Tax=Talaromyces marneffei TaxID=37727 RepID=B6QQW5_TALMQ|nr:uncharacterized protein EYB26_003236 [Talaromyces marneffei]EEA20684.1 conserved hypothetical protein [Talaromyces marneffei ATCC 18224]KAE8549652.1 hypothetical protein EYB25_008175 [Talaromyces marneffei]QGA15577.1 hypothetical protein EYB26_003236 [Talaromyces marneffei]